MKKFRVALVFALVLVAVLSLVSMPKVTAQTTSSYKTTLTDKDGLPIDVSDVVSNEIPGYEEYIKQNINEEYARNEKMEPADIIMVKNLIAQRDKFNSDMTIDAMWSDSEDAFIVLNDTAVVLYDTDDASDYYVAYVDTMHADSSSVVTDAAFAYTNINGEVISDAIYDSETGLAYVPKKYTAENKNETGMLNVQVELLQVVDSVNARTSIKTKVEVADDIEGNFATDGLVTVDTIAVKFGVRVALDEKAREAIDRYDIKVLINNTQDDSWDYYPSEGIIVFDNLPSTVGNLEITIDHANQDIERIETPAKTSAELFTQAGVWKVSGDIPDLTELIIQGSDTIDIFYDAWDHDNPASGYQDSSYNIYTDGYWPYLTRKVLNGEQVNMGNLQKNNTWLQYHVTLYNDVTINGVTVPAGSWLLKCVHDAYTFSTSQATIDRIVHSWELRIRIFQKTDNYLVVGMLTSKTHNQTGSGLFLIPYEGATGNLEVGKKNENNEFVPGAKLAISGPDGFYREIITEDHATLLQDIPQGDYNVKELDAPYGYIKNNDDHPIHVSSGDTVQKFVVDRFQRGTVTLIKKDDDDNPQGSPRLDGAIFKLVAAEEIKEGGRTVYSAGQVIDENVVTNVDGTTKVFTNMPLGKYYYEEVSNPYGYYKKDGHFDVEVRYQGQDSPNATDETALCREDQQYNDIRIVKKIGETSNTSEEFLEGAEFTATIHHRDNDYNQDSVVGVSEYEGNGVYVIKHLPVGDYEIEETVVPPKTLKAKNFMVTIDEGSELHDPYVLKEEGALEGEGYINEHGELVDTPKVMIIKMRKVDANRTDDDRVDWTQGDAQLEGAKYQIYEYNEETQKYDKEVYSITVDHKDEDGYWCAESGELLVGKYMVKEMIARSEDGHDYSYAKGYLVDPKEYEFEVIPEQQQERLSRHHSVSKEEVQRGFVYIWKEDEDRSNVDSENDSDKNPAAGAIMRLTLLSDTSIYYEVKLDEKGYGEFVETNDETHKSTAKHDSKKYYPYTIPFGKYKITETEEGTNTKRTNFYTQPENVDISKQDDYQYRIEMDVPVPVWLKIIKNDKENNTVVKIPNGTYKVWDVKGEKFLEFMVYPGNKVSEFNTTKDGYLILPEKIYPGEYIIYETNAPKGYYLDDEWRIPEEKADIGDATKGGKKIKIDKIATGLAEDAENPGQVQVGQYQYDANIYNTHLKANLLVEKKGEKLVNTTNGSATYKTTYDEEVKLTTVVPLYEEVGLEGVKFELKAKNDIYDVNGIKQASKDEVVSTFTTNEKGIGKSADVYPGEYILHEVSAPEGYVLADDKVVYLKNENQYEKVKTATTTVIDKRQNLTIDLEKLFEDSKYITGEEEKYAVFGVYVKENIKNYAGEETLFANDLVELIIVDKDNTTVTIDADLPEGKYYVKELYAAFPYSINAEEKTFELKYKGNEPNYKVPTKLTIKDDVESSTVLFVKIDQASDENLVMNGKTVQTSSNLDEKIDKTLDMFKEMSVDDLEAMADAISKFYEENDIKVVPQATYEIWLDEKGDKKLCERDANGKVTTAQFTTDGSGAFAIAGIPKGEYYLKEIVAPDGYELTEEPVKFIISDSDVGATLYQAIQETNVVPKLLHKKDVFTGDKVPNCLFEITDETGKVIVRSITDEFGDAYFPLSAFKDGEKYYFQEISVDNDVYYEAENVLYKLNTEKHEFTAKINPETKLWDAEPIEVVNNRPVKNFIFRKIDKDTGDVLKGCVFSIVLLDDEGNPYINDEGEMIYLVKDAVTGDNGECLIEDVPFGTYKVIEITPPEGYELPEEGEFENVFTIDYNSPDVVEFVLPNGDIPVVAISILGLVSIVGIAYVVVKKVKFSKEA